MIAMIDGAGLPAAAGLGASLRTWRALRRVKQAHAAELLGVNQATISRWESGAERPSARQAARLRELMAAAPASDADRALASLVRESGEAVHMICDLTHRLLAVSRPRTRRWGVSGAQLIGCSLWRYATDDIVAAEEGLADAGWFEPAAPARRVFTRANRSSEVPIRAGWMTWTRLRLSDGGYARLVRDDRPAAREPAPTCSGP